MLPPEGHDSQILFTYRDKVAHITHESVSRWCDFGCGGSALRNFPKNTTLTQRKAHRRLSGSGPRGVAKCKERYTLDF